MRRRYGHSISIIMLTAHDLGADFLTGIEAGADDYLVKPCNPHHMVAVVQRHLGFARATEAALQARR